MQSTTVLDSLLSNLKLRIRRIRRPARSREALHEFWQNPDPRSLPEEYLSPAASQRSCFLVDLVRRYCPEQTSVLEIGCNAGRNLDFLYRAGFEDLHAIEINGRALKLMGETYPDWAANVRIHNSSIEDALPPMESNRYGLVFTMAVLEHLHTDSERCFADIARITRDHLITIEDENKVSWRHFPRLYQRIFEPLGLQQIEETVCNEEELSVTPERVITVGNLQVRLKWNSGKDFNSTRPTWRTYEGRERIYATRPSRKRERDLSRVVHTPSPKLSRDVRHRVRRPGVGDPLRGARARRLIAA